MSYEEWIAEIEMWMADWTDDGVNSIYDIEDWNYRTNYDDGMTAKKAATLALKNAGW